MKPCNALITNYDIRVSERWSKCLELCLSLKLQDGGAVVFTTFGVYIDKYERNQFGYAIKKVMDIVGVTSLSQIKNKPIRALFENEGKLGDEIIGIGNFLEENWFIPTQESLWQNL